MLTFLASRLFQAVLAILAVTTAVFFMSRLTGDPLAALLPVEATAAEYERVREHWGLDRPIGEQYWLFLTNAIQGDFGRSYVYNMPAMDAVVGRLPATLQLALVTVLGSTVIAVPVGIWSGVRPGGWVDSFGKWIAALGQGVPAFWLGVILIWVFAVGLGVLPSSGYGGWRHMLMPAFSLGLYQTAAISRLMRSSMSDVMKEPYILYARARGLSFYTVVLKHALRNAAAVPLTYYGLMVGALLTGNVVVETVFGWPGVGRLVIESARARDFAVVQAVAVLISVLFILSNFIVDLLYGLLNPRVRVGAKAAVTR